MVETRHNWFEQPQIFRILDVLGMFVAMPKPNLPKLARMAEMVKMRSSRPWGRETQKICKH